VARGGVEQLLERLQSSLLAAPGVVIEILSPGDRPVSREILDNVNYFSRFASLKKRRNFEERLRRGAQLEKKLEEKKNLEFRREEM
jgi:hypothetical protein